MFWGDKSPCRGTYAEVWNGNQGNILQYIISHDLKPVITIFGMYLKMISFSYLLRDWDLLWRISCDVCTCNFLPKSKSQ